MTHPARPLAAGLTHHVTAHAIPERFCFPDGDSRESLRQLLAARLPDSAVDLHAYALMDGHLHILLSVKKDDALPRLMRVLLAQHARLRNRWEHTHGPLWLDRYASVVIEDEAHLVNSHFYIEANPWRAGLVGHPRDNDWTSYQANALGRGHGILSPHPVLIAMGTATESWRSRYYALMETYLQTANRCKSLTHVPFGPDPLAGLRLCEVQVT